MYFFKTAPHRVSKPLLVFFTFPLVQLCFQKGQYNTLWKEWSLAMEVTPHVSEYEIYGHSGPFFITHPRSLHFNSSCSHPVSRDTLQSWSHAGESVSKSLFIRKILFQSPGIREKTPGPHDQINVLSLGTQPSSFLAFLIPSLPHSFHQFIISSNLKIRKTFQSLDVSKESWSHFLLMQFHMNFRIPFFFSVVNPTLCVCSCYSQTLAFLLCCNFSNTFTSLLSSLSRVIRTKSKNWWPTGQIQPINTLCLILKFF